jgi:hypothetical protein
MFHWRRPRRLRWKSFMESMAQRKIALALLGALGIVAAAAGIVVLSGRTPARLSYEDELQRAADVVRDRQDVVRQRFRIGTYERFDLSQDYGLIVFSDAGTPKVVADIQFVGSYSDTSRTWLWAWANESLDPQLTRGSARVKEFGRQKHLERLTSAKWAATEDDGWEMATFQAYVTGADFMYRAPLRHGHAYLTLKNFRSAKPDERYPFVPAK